MNGQITRGHDPAPQERFHSTAQNSFQDYPTGYQARQTGEPIQERPKEVPQDVADKFYTGRIQDHNSHKGQTGYVFEKDAETFYGDGQIPLVQQTNNFDTIGKSSSQFFGAETQGFSGDYTGMQMTYQEARNRADE